MTSPPVRWAARGATALVVALSIGVPTASAAGVGQASPAPGRLDVFHRHDGNGSGTDPNQDSLVQVTRLNGTWQSPLNIGGRIHADSEISVTSVAGNRLDVAVRWVDNTVRTRTWTQADGWGSWVNLGGTVSGGPAIASYGSGKLAVVWRDTASSNVAIRTRSSSGWGAVASTPAQARTVTGLSLVGETNGRLTMYYEPQTPSPGVVPPTFIAKTAPSSDPTLGASWVSVGTTLSNNSVVSLTSSRAVVQRMTQTLAGAGTEVFWGGGRYGARNVTRLGPVLPADAWRGISLGGLVAGSPGSRPGESQLPNTPGASWSDRLSTSSPQLDLIWKTTNGCLQTRTKTDPAEAGAYTAEARIPTQFDGTRCVWPPRRGTLPLLKRTDDSDRSDLEPAHDAWWNGAWNAPFLSGNPQQDWISNNDGALVLHQSGDWVTGWAPRNWHPNAWVYRKGTSYHRNDGLHLDSAPTTKGFFVRQNGTNDLVAVHYGCHTQAEINAAIAANQTPPALGCTQPLLNLTLPAARTYWLKGADGKVPFLDTYVDSSGVTRTLLPTNCHGQSHTDGLLDLLACNVGEKGWDPTNRGQYKGAWLDDMFIELTDGPDGTWLSRIAKLETGVRISNQDVQSTLPFTQAQWAEGAIALLNSLKSGISLLKAAEGSPMRASEGKVAINFDWNHFNFARGTSTSISPTSYAGRALKAVTHAEIERGWIDKGITIGAASEFSWLRRKAFVDQVHALGVNVIEEKTTSGDLPADFPNANCTRTNGADKIQTPERNAAHYTSAQYNLASTLLNYKAGDLVGDMCEYYGRSWNGYQLDLGDPLPAPAGDAKLVDAGSPNGAWQRLYERGRVITVPTEGAGPTPPTGPKPKVTVSVPAGSRWYPPGSNTLTTIANGQVQLESRQGAVILYP